MRPAGRIGNPHYAYLIPHAPRPTGPACRPSTFYRCPRGFSLRKSLVQIRTPGESQPKVASSLAGSERRRQKDHKVCQCQGDPPEVGALSSCVCPPQFDGIANAPLGDLAKLVASGYSPIKIKKPAFWSRALTKGSTCEKHEFAAPS